MNLIPIITEYLHSHRRLVVPQLGAFIRKSEGDEVVFSEMLKRDDGVLRSLLVDRGLGEIEASGLIDRFIFELRHTVADGSVFQAEGLGVFAQGPNGTIRFRYLPQLSEKQSAADLEEQPSAPEQRLGIEAETTVPMAEPAGEGPVEAYTPDPSDSPAEPEEDVVAPSVRSESAPEESAAASADPDLSESADEKRNRIKELMRFSEEHPREHRSSSQPRRPDPSVRGLRYGKPQKSTDAYTYVNSAPSRRPDTFIVLAVLAVVIALGAILYGYWNDRRKERFENTYVEEMVLPEPSLSNSDI